MAHGSVRATQTHFWGNWRTFLFNLTCSFVDFYLKIYRTGVELIFFWCYTDITLSDPLLGLMVLKSQVEFWSPHWSLFIPTTKQLTLESWDFCAAEPVLVLKNIIDGAPSIAHWIGCGACKVQRLRCLWVAQHYLVIWSGDAPELWDVSCVSGCTLYDSIAHSHVPMSWDSLSVLIQSDQRGIRGRCL